MSLPAYAASRLEGAAAKRMEDHLRECAGCREMAESLREFGDAIREGGAALMEPHPSEAEIRGYARGESVSDRGRIERHLAVCATCSLEVETWKRGSGALFDSRSKPKVGGLHRWGSVALASAAGLVIGFGMARLLNDASAPGPSVSPTQDLQERVLTAGPLLILPRALRGEGLAVTYRIDPKQEFVAMACPVSIPDDATPDDRFRYEIRGSGGQVVWAREMTAEAIREHLNSTAEAVTLLAPTSVLEPGRYLFSLSPADKPEESLYRAELSLTTSP
ncbi:MAG: zf-HC2 domain-containing protein [Acidobacteria bacterium]|nr:zf-HC2 domain-containing protein [Acidobacteriota bacterium]